MQVPSHLVRATDASPLVEPVHTTPRVLVATTRSRVVEDGHARPGDVILDDTFAGVTQPVSIVGHSHVWILYPEFGAESNMPIWTKLDSAETRKLPECTWQGTKMPAAAECIRLILFSPEIGLRLLACQRQAVKPAVAVLREIDQLGTVIYGPLWTLTSVKAGKTHVPVFTHAGFCDEQTAKLVADAQAEINAMLAL